MIQSAIKNKIATDVIPRVYANVTPQRVTLPAITLDKDNSLRNRHLSGGRTVTGFQLTDFEITCWATSPEDAYGIGRQVVNSMENFTGQISDLNSPMTVHRVADILITSEIDGFDGRTEMYNYSVFITVMHTEV